jgi:hypothetical protein
MFAVAAATTIRAVASCGPAEQARVLLVPAGREKVVVVMRTIDAGG